MKQQSPQDEVNRYARLSEIILAVSSAKDLETALSESVEKIYAIFKFDSCWLALINRDAISYSVQQLFSIDGQIAPTKDSILLNIGVFGWVMDNQQMHLSGDWQPDEQEVIISNEPSQPQSILALPLQVSGQTIGAIAFTAKQQNYFEIVDLETAVTFTVHMALAIDRWKQVEQLTEMNRELEQRVEQRTEQLRITNRTLQEQIVEIKKIQKDLQNSKELAEKACQAKIQNWENISNELRVPLDSVINNISIVLNYFVDEERDYKLLENARTAAKKTLLMISRIS